METKSDKLKKLKENEVENKIKIEKLIKRKIT